MWFAPPQRLEKRKLTIMRCERKLKEISVAATNEG